MGNVPLQHDPHDNPPNLPMRREVDIASLLSQAVTSNLPVETMERLLAMAEHMEAREAKRQFDADMAAFQAECPVIIKTKIVRTDNGVIAYRYAPIESIISQVKLLLQKYHFSYAITTVTDRDIVTATCTAKHSLGHSEQSSFTVPLGRQTKMMSDTQVVAGALTFAKRYAFCNCFGILTGDEDIDGRDIGGSMVTVASTVVTDHVTSVTSVTKERLAHLDMLMNRANMTSAQLLIKSKEKDITKLTPAYAEQIITFLENWLTTKEQ
jgi:ERF superfamily